MGVEGCAFAHCSQYVTPYCSVLKHNLRRHSVYIFKHVTVTVVYIAMFVKYVFLDYILMECS